MKTQEAPEKNASGKAWSAGPYVRKSERDQWNVFYEEFSSEMRMAKDYPEGAKLNDLQIDVLAYNCAYRAIWALREEDDAR